MPPDMTYNNIIKPNEHVSEHLPPGMAFAFHVRNASDFNNKRRGCRFKDALKRRINCFN